MKRCDTPIHRWQAPCLGGLGLPGWRVAVAIVATANLALWASAAYAAPVDDSAALTRAEKNLRELTHRAKDAASEITSYALSLIGVDYRFGGNSPDQGLDCSGLIRYVFQQATGLSLPRSSREQARLGEAVSKDQLQPGDLVFFNTRRFQFSHVGLYIGDNRFVHAPSSGGAVQVVSLDNIYWQKAFNGARRIVGSLPAIGSLVSTANAAVAKPARPASLAPEDAAVATEAATR
jgi:cell wall-associated NlpC family hydrolase